MTKQERLVKRLEQHWAGKWGPGTRFRRLRDVQQYNMRLIERYGMLANKVREKYGTQT